MVNTVLARDKNWVRWKVENCPSIVKEAEPAERYAETKASAKVATTSRRMRAKPMGATDLTFLSEADNAKGLERLKDPARLAIRLTTSVTLLTIAGSWDRRSLIS